MSGVVAACVLLAITAPRVEEVNARDVCEAIEHFSYVHGRDAFMIAAMAWHESRFNPLAVNERSNARGPLQVLAGRRWSPQYTNEELATPWLGVEAGFVMIVRWQQWPRRAGRNWVACFAAGGRCKASIYVARAERTAVKLRALSYRWDTGVCQ